MHFFLVSSFLLIQPSAQHENSGSDKPGRCGNRERSIYSAASNQWPTFLREIDRASADHVDCATHDNGCSSCYDDVIKKDLLPFKDGISEESMEAASNISRITKYQIINHQLYRSEFCMFPFRCRGIEHFLTGLLADLPDTELYLNTRDWPMAGRHFGPAVPVFSFSKTKDYWDIMFPAWTFWEGGPALGIYPNGLGRWDNYIQTLGEAEEKSPWKSKTSQGFFRGSRTSSERDPLVLLSRKCPDLVDAQYTKNQAWKSDKDTLGLVPAEEVKLEEHCRFKYLFNYRGVAASFRYKHLFLCKSLVFHVGEEWIEFFYPSLRPWFHYIPVSNRATEDDIQSLLEFAEENDEKMREIAENGANFISTHLKFSDIFCYWRTLLQSYTKLIKYSVVRDPDLKQVK